MRTALKRLLPAAALCLLCACTPQLSAPTGATSSPAAPSPTREMEGSEVAVYTDWSQLGERERPEPVGSRWYEAYSGELVPREDYGPLIPYAGLRLADGWPAESGCLYGLMTLDGRVVTDPVYCKVSRPGTRDEKGRRFTLPLLVLVRADEAREGEKLYAVAAADGSWCTPFSYVAFTDSAHGLLLFGLESLSVMDAEGTILHTWTLDEMGLSQAQFDFILSDIRGGDGSGGHRRGEYMSLFWDDSFEQIQCLNLNTGQQELLSADAWAALNTPSLDIEWATAVPNAEWLYDSMLGQDAPALLFVMESGDTATTVTFYRQDGTPIPELTSYNVYSNEYRQVNLLSGIVEVLDWNTASYYDLDTLECIFRTYLSYEGD